MYLVLMVVDNEAHVDPLLMRWEKAGVSGVTILESTGWARRSRKRPLALRYLYGQSESHEAVGNYTLLAIVPDEAMARRCLEEAEALIGDLNLPNTGVFAAWPLALAKGIPSSPTAED
ncbi:hypothetical protein QYE77_09885 [Thermanaerothrix sp. 4228-RoL]|uniref:Nitrogen regulatory protein P-II n=1 Tax=Thermanaerothrix solaris TaxID=3058434 RepID=A0ABU3NP14_9CHLR|nr:hypothetical protein [Thermanaerothrix sp. 4228-RoL]MDT8898579.1 hypothetical protein [Thermanaerothrix sp. 4228-RoL]